MCAAGEVVRSAQEDTSDVKFADPLVVQCPRCAAESRHNSKDLLALTATCPTCGSSLKEIGIQMGVTVDDSAGFWTWAELVMVVEDRLGVMISDEDALGGRERFAALTLRELAGVILGYLSPEARSDERAVQVALEAASTLAKARIEPGDLDLPILEAMRFPHWAEKQGRTRRCTGPL
jgi:hypothetical protein